MNNIKIKILDSFFDELMFTVMDTNNTIIEISNKLCDFLGYEKEEMIKTSHILPNQNNNLVLYKKNTEMTILNVISKQLYIDGIKFYINYYNVPKNEDNDCYFNKKFLIKEKRIFSELSENNSKTGFGILFDIIGFSYINETYGRNIGDKILQLVGILLSELKNIEIFKLDGDEFLLLVQNFDMKTAKNIFGNKTKKINKIFKEKLVIEDNEIKINFKLVGGLFKYENMLLNLNIYLKSIKEKKLTSFFVENNNFFPKMEINYINTLNLLDNAIKNNFVFLEYQPIFDNKTKIVNKYESLVRIKDSNKIIYPDDFIGIAQKTNYYLLLTETIVTLAFQKFKAEKNIQFSINLDFLDIQNDATVAFIFDMLEQFPYPENVIFELTEVNQIRDYAILIDFISKVKFFNSKIAIDDFGSGYANFELLSKIEFDFIKIDGSLIKNINNPKILSMIEMIVSFAKANNVNTIAEYVSSEHIYKKVLELGIDYSQGWLFGKSDVSLLDKHEILSA